MSITEYPEPCRVTILYQSRQSDQVIETTQALLPSMRAIGFKTLCLPEPQGTTITDHVASLLAKRASLNAINDHILFTVSDIQEMHTSINITLSLLEEMNVQDIEYCSIGMLPSTKRTLEKYCSDSNNCDESVHYHVRNYYMVDQILRECAKGKDGVTVLISLKNHDIGQILREVGYSIKVEEFFFTSLSLVPDEDMFPGYMTLEQALRSRMLEDSEYEHLERITVYDLYANPLLDPITGIKTKLTGLSYCAADGLDL